MLSWSRYIISPTFRSIGHASSQRRFGCLVLASLGHLVPTPRGFGESWMGTIRAPSLWALQSWCQVVEYKLGVTVLIVESMLCYNSSAWVGFKWLGVPCFIIDADDTCLSYCNMIWLCIYLYDSLFKFWLGLLSRSFILRLHFSHVLLISWMHGWDVRCTRWQPLLFWFCLLF